MNVDKQWFRKINCSIVYLFTNRSTCFFSVSVTRDSCKFLSSNVYNDADAPSEQILEATIRIMLKTVGFVKCCKNLKNRSTGNCYKKITRSTRFSTPYKCFIYLVLFLLEVRHVVAGKSTWSNVVWNEEKLSQKCRMKCAKFGQF